MLVAILNHFSAWVSEPKFVGIYYSRLALWAQYKIMRYFLYNYYTRFQKKVKRKKSQIYHQKLEIPVTCIIHQIWHNISKGALNSFCLFFFFKPWLYLQTYLSVEFQIESLKVGYANVPNNYETFFGLCFRTKTLLEYINLGRFFG